MIETTLCYLEKDGAYLMLHRINQARGRCGDGVVRVDRGESEGGCPQQQGRFGLHSGVKLTAVREWRKRNRDFF